MKRQNPWLTSGQSDNFFHLFFGTNHALMSYSSPDHEVHEVMLLLTLSMSGLARRRLV